MDQRVAQELIRTRERIREKYLSLKSDITRAEMEIQHKFKPLTQPLQELLTTVKKEPVLLKAESSGNVSFQTPMMTPRSLIPQKRSLIPKRSNTPRQFTAATSRNTSFEPELLNTTMSPITSIATPSTPRATPSEPQFLETETLAEDIPIPSMEALISELSAAGSHPAFEEYLQSYEGLARTYVEGMFKDINEEYDHTYGVRFNPVTDKFKIGDSELDFAKEDIVITTPLGHQLTYPGTPGLYELLFKKEPIGAKASDETQYRDIVNRTNAARRHYNAEEQIQGNTGKKYASTVKRILASKPKPPGKKSRTHSSTYGARTPLTRSRTSSLTHKGGAVIQMLNLHNKKVEYVPWKNPNTLVDRLRILLSSQAAGHTGHTNEIIYLINELRSAKIIK